ncbi:nSTAND1 domain-containing NTPase [Jidongwangia harbinensis]|uniref:nSTAND1 domain-containing NTPase n=1 Tax=Jidongwangia harbinensis TaxID=2878561 RepID=UPI001CDA1ACA|nr:hypothetical protein [Jidongwangia harbinensis]MCA2216330.1 hypothetical protein [Jidongwangia harbinensis]MCA2217065.1 hypothetical protein [Jidongwangia harbinensis]
MTPEHSVARVLGRDQKPVGLAFVVGERQLLTAAHVVNAALGRPQRTTEEPDRDAYLLIEFPFGGVGEEMPVCRAAVAAWGPAGGADLLTHDCAGLVLKQPKPVGTPPLALVLDDPPPRAAVQMWGPSPDRHAPGHVGGELMGDIDKGRIQVDQVIRGAFAVGAGFSGGPVWLIGTGEVAGILHAAGGDGTDVYVVRADVAVDMWPDQLYRPPASPYPGLRSFEVGDAERFFGRETFVGTLLADAEKRPLLAIMGASGSGKSSVLAAGLVAGLRRTASQVELFVRPGDRVVTAIAAAMGRVSGHADTDRWRRSLATLGLAGALAELAVLTGHERAVLVVDQLEQALSHRHDERELELFIGMIGDLVEAERDQAAVIALGVRDDFYGRFVTLETRLGGYLQRNARPLRQMNETELRSAIVGPAELANSRKKIRLDDRLVAQIVKDFAGQAGDLPLVQFTLRQLWAQRNEELTLESYVDMGGLRRGLILHADECLARLTEDERLRAKHVFCRFTRTDLAGVGRPVLRTELSEADWAVVNKLADASCRLVTLLRDSATGAEAAEIAHEILLREWPCLVAWRADDAGFLTWLDHTELRKRDWTEHGDDFLLRGAVLQQAVVMVAERPSETWHLAELVVRSTAAEQRRIEAEGASLRRRNRVRRLVVMTLVGLLVLATGTAGIAIRESRRAAEQQQVATARGLVFESALLREPEPATALRLAAAAYAITPTRETRVGLLDTVIDNRFAAALPGITSEADAIAFVPDRPVVLVGTEDATATFWDLTDPSRPHPLSTFTSAQRIWSAEFSANHKIMLLGMNDRTEVWRLDGPRYRATRVARLAGSAGRAILDSSGTVALTAGDSVNDLQLWNLTDARHPRRAGRLRSPGVQSPNYGLSDDGKLAVVQAGGFNVWEVTDLQRPRRLGRLDEPDPFDMTLTVARNGKMVTAGSGVVYDLSNPGKPQRYGELKTTYETQDLGGASVAVTPSGDTAVMASPGQPNSLWDLRDPQHPSRTATFGRSDSGAAVSTDGRLAATSDGSRVTIWDLRPPAAIPQAARIPGSSDGGINEVVPIGPDRKLLLAGGRRKGEALLWNLTDPRAPRRVGRLSVAPQDIDSFAAAATQSIVLTGSRGQATVWEVTNPARPVRLGAFGTGMDGPTYVSVSDDARMAVITAVDASASEEGNFVASITIWDLSNPARPARLSELQTDGSPLAIAMVSPDARLAASTMYNAEAESDAAVFWDISEPTRPRRLTGALSDAAMPFVFDRTGTRLFTGGKETSYLWDVRDLGDVRRIGAVPSTDPGVGSASFSADGRVLLTGGEDQNVTVWDLYHPEDPKRLAILRGHTNAVSSVFFGPGEKTVVSGSPSFEVFTWDVGEIMALAADPRAKACAMAGRGLDRSEWAHYIPGLPYRQTC